MSTVPEHFPHLELKRDLYLLLIATTVSRMQRSSEVRGEDQSLSVSGQPHGMLPGAWGAPTPYIISGELGAHGQTLNSVFATDLCAPGKFPFSSKPQFLCL